MDSAPPNIRSSLLARNTLLNLVGQGLPLIVAVVSMPLVIRGLGPEQFGILALAWVVLGYFGMFDLGMGRAATKFVAEALGAGQRMRVAAIVWTSVSVQTVFGILGGLVLAGITPFLVEHILSIPGGLVADARTTFYLLAISVPVVVVTSSFRGALEAAQRFDLVNAVRIPFSSANFLLPMVGLLLGWGLVGIVALLVAARALALAVHYLLCVRYLPNFGRLPRFHLAELRVLISFGGWVTVSGFVGPILVHLDRFMIGALMTVAAVAYYTAPYEMVTRLWIIPTSLLATLFPAFSSLSGQGQLAQLEVLVSRSLKYLLLSLGPVVIVIVAYGRQILEIWLGPEFAGESVLALQILAVGVLINSLAHVPFSLIQALGRPDLTAKFHLAELPLHILLVWWLVTLWGIPGAALAWSLRVGIDALLLFVAAGLISPLSLKSMLGDRIPQTALMLAMLGVSAVVINALVTPVWLSFSVLALVLGIAGLLAWNFLFVERDRAQVSSLLRTVIAR